MDSIVAFHITDSPHNDERPNKKKYSFCTSYFTCFRPYVSTAHSLKEADDSFTMRFVHRVAGKLLRDSQAPAAWVQIPANYRKASHGVGHKRKCFINLWLVVERCYEALCVSLGLVRPRLETPQRYQWVAKQQQVTVEYLLECNSTMPLF